MSARPAASVAEPEVQASWLPMIVIAMAQMLIRAGANVKAVNRYGVTPIYLACTNGNAAMIELFLKAGADPNTALPEGETALMTIARAGNDPEIGVHASHHARGAQAGFGIVHAAPRPGFRRPQSANPAAGKPAKSR